MSRLREGPMRYAGARLTPCSTLMAWYPSQDALIDTRGCLAGTAPPMWPRPPALPSRDRTGAARRAGPLGSIRSTGRSLESDTENAIRDLKHIKPLAANADAFLLDSASSAGGDHQDSGRFFSLAGRLGIATALALGANYCRASDNRPPSDVPANSRQSGGT